jgi:hypothetical protein
MLKPVFLRSGVLSYRSATHFSEFGLSFAVDRRLKVAIESERGGIDRMIGYPDASWTELRRQGFSGPRWIHRNRTVVIVSVMVV